MLLPAFPHTFSFIPTPLSFPEPALSHSCLALSYYALLFTPFRPSCPCASPPPPHLVILRTTRGREKFIYSLFSSLLVKLRAGGNVQLSPVSGYNFKLPRGELVPLGCWVGDSGDRPEWVGVEEGVALMNYYYGCP